MNTLYKFKHLIARLVLVFSFFTFGEKLFASHAAGADLTYQCLGGNNYRITLSFYRDCQGVPANPSMFVNISSVSCNFSQSVNLQRQGAPQIVTPVCPTSTTRCSGGTAPGIEKYIYSLDVTLQGNCPDWYLDWDLPARNQAITTIQNPSGQNLHIRTLINNANGICNSSSTFSNNPVYYICGQQDFCFDHGVQNPDGDSLAYSLVTPLSNGNTTVTYKPGYSFNAPVLSNPAFPFTFDNQTGGICFNATNVNEITVWATEIKEYRNGVLVGSVMRDIQFYVIPCNNQTPVLTTFDLNTTVNNSNNDTLVCAGKNLTFQIKSRDADAGDVLTMFWNNNIPNASFSVDNSNPSVPIATFSWTPTAADISTTPHCFTVDVLDDNCPMRARFSSAYCITVTGIDVDLGPDILGAACNINQNVLPNITGGTAPYVYAWGNGTNSSNYNLTCGPHTVTVTDVTGCKGKDSIYVDCPQIELDTAFNNEVCDGQNNGKAWVTANGSTNYIYRWSNGGSSDTISNLADGFYVVTVSDQGGCLSTSSLEIKPGVIPPQIFITSGAKYCKENPDTLIRVSYPGGLWTGPGLVTQGANTYFSPSTVGVGVYNIQYTVAGACGATGDTDIVVFDAGLDTVIKHNVLCYGDGNGSVEFRFLQADSAKFNLLGGNSFTQVGTVFNNLFPGSYTCHGVWIDSIYCPLDTVVDIMQPAKLKPGFIKVDATCFDAKNGNIIANFSGGTPFTASPYYTHSWASTDPNFPSNVSTANIINLDSGIYTLTVKDSNLCSKDTIIRISKPSPFVFTSSQDSSICDKALGKASILNISGATPGYTYAWNTSPSQTTNQATNIVPGIYTVTIKDSKACDTIVTIQVMNKPGPTISVTFDSTKCKNSCDGVGKALGSGGALPQNYQYAWSNGANTANANNLCAGKVKVTLTDSYNCTAIDSVTIVSPDSVKAFISKDTIICIGTPATLMASASGGKAPYTYGWTNTFVGTGPHVTFPNAVTCYVLAVTDRNNCVSKPVQSCVNFHPALRATAFSNKTICAGDQVILTATGAGGNPNLPITYSWDNGASVNAFYQLNPAGNFPDKDTIKLVISDACSPNDTAQVVIDFHEPKKPSFTPDSIAICPHEEVNFINTSTSASASCVWNYGDGKSSVGCYPTPNYAYHKPGDYRVILSVVSPQGCKSADTGYVHVAELPVANFSVNPNPTSIRDITFYFTDQSSGDINQWNWYFYDNDQKTLLDSLDLQNPSFDFYNYIHGNVDVLDLNDTGHYPVRLHVITPEGCEDDTIIPVIMEPLFLFYIPNTFTPNGDTKNEFFYPVMFGESNKDYNFEIYNRWGQLIFRTNINTDKWNGTAPEIGQGDTLVQDGVYSWKIIVVDLKGNKKEYIGHVNVLK